MTSLAMTEGWNMTSTGPKGGPDRGPWRDVAVAWTLAAVLAGALVLTITSHDRVGPPANLWSLAPSAGHAHQKAADPEDAAGDETCSDRDYANELC